MSIKNLVRLKSFLLDNKTVKQTVFKNIFWLSFGIGMTKIFSFVLVMYSASILGALEFGKFNFALSFTGLFIIFSDLGLSAILIREFSGSAERLKEFYSIISLKIILGLAMLVLVLIGSFFITGDPDVQKIIFILAVFTLVSVFIDLSSDFFQARQRMEYQSWIQFFLTLLIMLFGLFAVFFFPSAENLSWAYLLASLIAFAVSVFFFHFRVFPLKICWNRLIWKKFILMSWPLGFTALCGSLYNHIDSVMMGYWNQIIEVGWYNAAHRTALLILIPISLISASFYPQISRFFKESKEKLQNFWSYQMEITLFLIFPLVFGGIALGPRIIESIFGSDFLPAVFAFQLLILMTGIICLHLPFSKVLIVSNQQKKVLLVYFVGAAVNVILNLILIPRYSLYGAAIATITAHSLMFLMYFEFVVRFTPIDPLKFRFLLIAVLAVFSSLFMYFVISLPRIYNLNVIISVLTGAIIYFIVFFILKKTINRLVLSANYE